jgi:hypothetical protein
MTMPSNINDREMQKFYDVSEGSTAVKIVGPDGTQIATETTLATASTTLTTISGKLPATLGQKTMANSLAAVLASDHSDIKVNIFGATAAVSPRKTFSVAAVFQAAVGGATDIFTILGSASGIVYVTKATFTATQTTASTGDLTLVLRSTANSGGSSSVIAPVPHLSTDSNIATTRAYTANPSTGYFVGYIYGEKYHVPTTTGYAYPWVWEADEYCKPIALINQNYSLSINLIGRAMAGNSVCCAFEYFHI